MVIDIPAGFGRHSCWLREIGHQVIAVDLEIMRMRFVNQTPGGHPMKSGSIDCVVANAERVLPFRANAFDLALVIHYVSRHLFREVRSVLRPGGYLIFETFGAQGGNRRELPSPGAIAEDLSSSFDLLDYRERIAGAPEQKASVVKLLAQKR
jgi:SAM-dependent methyltransferase